MTTEELKTIIVDDTISNILMWAKHDDMNSLYGFISARVFSDFKDVSDEEIRQEAYYILDQWEKDIERKEVNDE